MIVSGIVIASVLATGVAGYLLNKLNKN